MSLRERERQSIADFLTANADKLSGVVLDIGCGKQPYHPIVEAAGGTYLGFDRPSFPGSVISEEIGEDWEVEDADTVIMTQVWQYIEPWDLLHLLAKLSSGSWSLKPGGWLLATGPTNWPVIEPGDLWRLTTAGVYNLLKVTKFEVESVETRHAVIAEGERWSCGWQAVARSSQS